MNRAELVKALAELLAEKMEIGEKPTNGEVIQALFDGLVIDDNPGIQKYAILMTYDFWNAPYKIERGE